MALRSQQMAWMGGAWAAALALALGAQAKDPPGKAGKSEESGPAKPAAARAHGAGAPAAGAQQGAKAEQGAPGSKDESEGKGKGAHAEHGAGEASARGQARAGEVRAEPAKEAAAERAERRAERAEYKSKLAELRERQAQGKLSKEELKKELAALRESRAERRDGRREALRERWGNELAEPAAREELRHHEQRMARLERMALLAQTERKGAAKDALAARIEKLIAQENERHERKMSQLSAKGGNTRPASAVEPPKPVEARANPEQKAGEKSAEKGAKP